MSDSITERIESTHITTSRLVGLPLELKEMIFGYVLEKECKTRIRLPFKSVGHISLDYCPSLLFVNKQIHEEFEAFFHRKVIFVVVCPDTNASPVIPEQYSRAMRTFGNIEVRVSHTSLSKYDGRTYTEFQLHEKNVTTIVLKTSLLWDVMDFPSSLETHHWIIALLQYWQSTWQNSVITTAPLDRVTKYKAKRAVTAKRECLMNHREVQRAWMQAFGADMIVNKIVAECSPPRD